MYRPFGTRYDPKYAATHARSGRVSVACWGWISLEGPGTIHRICGHLNQGKYRRLLQNHMLLYTRERYPDEIIPFVQDNSPIHTTRPIQNWFAERQDIELIHWPRRSPDLNPIENVWACLKKHMKKNRPNPPPNTADAFWELVENAWDSLAENQLYFERLVGSMPRRFENIIRFEFVFFIIIIFVNYYRS